MPSKLPKHAAEIRQFDVKISAMEYGLPRRNLDRKLIAANVKGARLNQRLSQTELARRSSLDLASVYRVEKGAGTHLRTLKKIARGLNIVFEDLLLQKSREESMRPFAVHRAKDAKWFASEDRRARIPEEHIADYQSELERLRLFKLGFVPFFMCPPLIIPPEGPGIVMIELFERIPGPFNAEFYEDAALYLLRGGAVGTVGDADFELEEGDWIAFKSSELKSFGAAPQHDSALMLWIGATRIKKHTRS